MIGFLAAGVKDDIEPVGYFYKDTIERCGKVGSELEVDRGSGAAAGTGKEVGGEAHSAVKRTIASVQVQAEQIYGPGVYEDRLAVDAAQEIIENEQGAHADDRAVHLISGRPAAERSQQQRSRLGHRPEILILGIVRGPGRLSKEDHG